MPLSDFINRHAGQTAWLFGKGPSFSTFDFKTAGPIRAAINDVIAHVPDCLYGFANDGVARWAELYKKGQILFQPSRCLHEYDSTADGAVACDVVTFADDSEDRRLTHPREIFAEKLSIRRGTLGSALQILHIMGIRTVHLVGIDGGGQHAEGYKWRTRLRHDHAKDYDAIRSAAIDAAHIMGITLKFHNQDNTMENDGRIFVRMTRNCFANLMPYREGEIASFSPKTARELVGNRSAEYYDPPAKSEPQVETAESKTLAASENSMIRTTKGRGKR